MSTINLAGYKFIPLADLSELKITLHDKCASLALKGTILLSAEGINMNLAGSEEHTQLFKAFLQDDKRFADILFHETASSFQPFKQLKVKIKKEIITMRSTEVHPEHGCAPSVTPQEFKHWLDEKRDITVLDTRNDYEVSFGTFKNAINPKIDNFSDFTKVTKTLDSSKPVVMFCTGGIRCEKAALHLQEHGFEVYQLQRGILNYFKEVGGAHYEGECFVFDQRVAVNPDLEASGTQQCKLCQGPIWLSSPHSCS